MDKEHTTNRAHTLRVRLSKTEAAAIQQAADAAGLSMSSWCRMVLRVMYPSAKADGFSLRVLGRENFRHHYSALTCSSALADIASRVMVCGISVAARDALEGGLVGPVLLVDATAGAALPRGIAGIDKDDRDAGALRLIVGHGADSAPAFNRLVTRPAQTDQIGKHVGLGWCREIVEGPDVMHVHVLPPTNVFRGSAELACVAIPLSGISPSNGPSGASPGHLRRPATPKEGVLPGLKPNMGDGQIVSVFRGKWAPLPDGGRVFGSLRQPGGLRQRTPARSYFLKIVQILWCPQVWAERRRPSDLSVLYGGYLLRRDVTSQDRRYSRAGASICVGERSARRCWIINPALHDFFVERGIDACIPSVRDAVPVKNVVNGLVGFVSSRRENIRDGLSVEIQGDNSLMPIGHRSFPTNGDDTEIDTKPIFSLKLGRLRNIAGCGQHPLAAHEAQIDLALAVGHQPLLMLAHHDGDGDASLDRPDADRRTVAHEADYPVIVGLCGVLAEARRDLAVDLEGISDFGDGPHGSLSGQAEAGPQLSIAKLVQVELPERLGVMADLRKPRRSLVAASERRRKRKRLRLRRDQLYGGYQLHAFKYRDVVMSCQERRALLAAAIPLPTKAGSFSRRFA